MCKICTLDQWIKISYWKLSKFLHTNFCSKFYTSWLADVFYLASCAARDEKPLAQADACFMENHRYPVAKPLRFAIEFLTTKKIYWMRMPDEILLEPSPGIPDLSLEMAKEVSNVRFMYGRPSRHPHRFLIDRKTHVIYHHHSGKGGSAYVLEPSQTLPDRFKKPFNRFTMPTYCSEEFRY